MGETIGQWYRRYLRISMGVRQCCTSISSNTFCMIVHPSMLLISLRLPCLIGRGKILDFFWEPTMATAILPGQMVSYAISPEIMRIGRGYELGQVEC